jgi:hypothetical protein
MVNNEFEIIKLFDMIKIEYNGYLRNIIYEEPVERIEPLGYKCKASAHNEFAIKIGLDRHGTLICMRVHLLTP